MMISQKFSTPCGGVWKANPPGRFTLLVLLLLPCRPWVIKLFPDTKININKNGEGCIPSGFIPCSHLDSIPLPHPPSLGADALPQALVNRDTTSSTSGTFSGPNHLLTGN